MTLGLWNSVAIVLGFSFLVIVLDEYVVKPWRHRKWERLAAIAALSRVPKRRRRAVAQAMPPAQRR
jgi:hypothetical protein